MSTTIVKFEGSQGYPLAARLELPPNDKPHHFAIFAHCFTCSKNLNAPRVISRSLAMQGFGVLRFDFTGLGESEGEFADTNFSSNVEDLMLAAKWLEENYEAPSLLVGHSLGGAAVLMAAAKLNSVGAVATVGAPADVEHVTNVFREDIDKIEEQGEAEVSIAGRSFKLKRQFIADLREHRLIRSVENLKKPLLITHAPFDKIVGIDNAASLYKAAKHPKSFISLDEADHLLSNSADAQYVADVMATWSHHYLPAEAAQIETNRPVAVRIGKQKYTTEVQMGTHSMYADEPKEQNGSDLGPSPYDLLLSSLGTCTAMTLRMYADRKKWPLEEVKVHLSQEKVHAEDGEGCEEKQAKITLINREVEIVGDLDESQRSRLLEIANSCPVHKTLSSTIKVETEIYKSEED